MTQAIEPSTLNSVTFQQSQLSPVFQSVINRPVAPEQPNFQRSIDPPVAPKHKKASF
jgi:hypothetical protein